MEFHSNINFQSEFIQLKKNFQLDSNHKYFKKFRNFAQKLVCKLNLTQKIFTNEISLKNIS